MSSSIESSKIDLLNNEETVKSKLNKADCVAGDPENGVMALLQYMIFVIKEDRKETFVVERPEKYGGNLVYETYAQLEEDFVAKKLHPLDLKNSVAKEINNLLKNFRDSKELHKLHLDAHGN